MAKLGGKFDLSALKRCHLGSDGGPWYVSLQDYIKGTEVVHHLDPWHINRMVQGAFLLKATRNRAYKLLYAGDIGPLIGYLAQKAVQDTRSRVKVKQLLRYVRRNRKPIEAAGPSLGTMEGTNAHVYVARRLVEKGGIGYGQDPVHNILEQRASAHNDARDVRKTAVAPTQRAAKRVIDGADGLYCLRKRGIGLRAAKRPHHAILDEPIPREAMARVGRIKDLPPSSLRGLAVTMN